MSKRLDAFQKYYPWIASEGLDYFRVRLTQAREDSEYALGVTLEHCGDRKMQEAAQELRRSDSLRPDMPETLYALGRALVVSDPTAAEQALDRVIAVEKQSQLAGQAYLLLASTHRKQGKSELAARDMAEYKRIHSLTSKTEQ